MAGGTLERNSHSSRLFLQLHLFSWYFSWGVRWICELGVGQGLDSLCLRNFDISSVACASKIHPLDYPDCESGLCWIACADVWRSWWDRRSWERFSLRVSSSRTTGRSEAPTSPESTGWLSPKQLGCICCMMLGVRIFFMSDMFWQVAHAVEDGT